MARPQKFTVDYFSHDGTASQGRTLTILSNNFGHEGISAWWQILETISSTNNHIVSISNSEDLEYLAARLHFKPERLKEILDKMAYLDAIDKELYSRGLIWSQNFVDRLKPVYDSRKQELPQKPSLIVDNNNVNLSSNSVSSLNNSIDLPDNTQTKLKRETKENIIMVFDHWNKQGIVVHKTLDGKESSIKSKLEIYSVEEIISAINNYAEIIKGEQYYFKYKWTLKDFLRKGFEKFLDGDIARKNYLKGSKPNSTNTGVVRQYEDGN